LAGAPSGWLSNIEAVAGRGLAMVVLPTGIEVGNAIHSRSNLACDRREARAHDPSDQDGGTDPAGGRR
jgi:hypothetical protein